MFALIKNKTNILRVIEDYSNFALKQIGESYTTEDDTCPFCGHHGCFRITEALGLWKCFSEDISGDSIRYVAKVLDKKDWEAAIDIAKKYDIKIPNDYSPVQEIFNCAAIYYHRRLIEDSKAYPELTFRTPLQYQTDIRKHKKETLERFSIGWSDGGLVKYLDSIGFEESLIVESGLVNKKGDGDFLPTKCFIYPHYVRGRVSHFTFKDPIKKLQYQMPNKHKLNSHVFYNSDSIKQEIVYVVEGENDALSVAENNVDVGVIASIGMISGAQIDWMIENLADKQVITCFDPDHAGDTYREKVKKAQSKFKNLLQLKLPNDQDIDDFLTSGKTLEDATNEGSNHLKSEDKATQSAEGSGTGGIESEDVDSDGNIFEKEGCYYKIRYKEGQPVHTKISDFIIKLRIIYIQGSNREREIVIIRDDGKVSDPFVITSEVKVSLKSFKTVIANAVDATFYGQEMDLALLWNYIYKKSEEKEVFLPQVVGRSAELKGWMFKNCFITDTGIVLRPDPKDDIIWRNGSGIKASSLNSHESNKEAKTDIPNLSIDLDPEFKTEIVNKFFKSLAENLGNTGMAITMLGWAKACIYSNEIHAKYGSFPFMFFWGKNGKGKTVIGRWILSLYGMDPSGHGTVGQLGSAVGFQRKVGYYGSLPLIMDEIRADRDTVEHASMFRSWYNRFGRVLGMKDDYRVKEQAILSCFMFIGEDQFADNASRERCINIRIPASGREMNDSYDWVENNRERLSCIGYDWIVESTGVSVEDTKSQLELLDKALVKNGCNPRISKNWASIGLYGAQIADRYFPSFDYRTYLINASKSDTIEQALDDKVLQFFEIVEGMQVAANPKISGEHIRVEGNTLYLWYAEIFRLVQAEPRGHSIREDFSKNAIKQAIKEEDYCLKGEDARVPMGINQTVRRVLTFDVNKAPDVIKNLGRYYLGNK